jgi:DNA-binding NtrC family response regulator
MRQASGDLLFIDDDADLRSALADLVEAVHGRHVVGAADLDELRELGSKATDCSLAIIDVNLGAGKPNGFEALAWLKRHGFHGKAVFLTGHARTGAQAYRAHEFAEVPLLAKPLGVDALLSLIETSP